MKRSLGYLFAHKPEPVLKYILVLIMTCFFESQAVAHDPYQNISFHKLDNGISVVLAPSLQAKNFKLNVRVKVGYDVEGKYNLGVSHLLEHLLFRDSRLDEGQTYLQLIQEAGGNINAAVNSNRTYYEAEIPAAKREWLIMQFAKMLFHRQINQDDVSRAKSAVSLEIGEVGWLSSIVGADVFGAYQLRYFPVPGFFETDFGISQKQFSSDEYRLSNQKLSHKQLMEHYRDYYRPSNMVLFASGNFTLENLLPMLKKEFGRIPDQAGKTILEKTPVPNNTPYWRVEPGYRDGTWIYMGTKFFRLGSREKIILHVYLDYIAHRLMKELRNKRGETYTANVYADSQFKAGYSMVSFETSHNEFTENLEYVRSLFDREARKGELSDEQIFEAINLTKGQRYELADVDADSLMGYAEHYYGFLKEHDGTSSPYEIITSLTPDEFRKALSKIFLAENAYTELYLPYVYFKIESLVIFFLSVTFSIIFFKRLLGRQVDEVKIRWVQKITYTPSMILEVSAIFFFSALILSLLTSPLERRIFSAPWYNSLTLWPGYVFSFIEVFVFIGMIMGLLALFPRKLIIEGDDLLLKSMALYLVRVKKESIKSFIALSLFQLIRSPEIWFNTRFRYFNFNWMFWKKGLALEVDGGATYYLGFKDAEKVKEDLDRHLHGGAVPVKR